MLVSSNEHPGYEELNMNQEGESIPSNDTPCTQEACEASQASVPETVAPQEGTPQQDKGESTRGLYCKVSPKGGVSVYGLQRMPVTLYVEQWHRLLEFGDELRAFLGEHDAELKRKEK
jgi:hypothetical protein